MKQQIQQVTPMLAIRTISIIKRPAVSITPAGRKALEAARNGRKGT